MRTSLVFASSILLVGCAGGVYVPATTTVAAVPRTPAPAPVVLTPAPRVTPVIMPPVGVTIVRVEDSQLQVSTNQPAYLVVFEIVPGRGATLVYPRSSRERPAPLVGSNWLSVSWPSARFASDDRYVRRDRGAADPRRRDDQMSRRYIYAIASERPLRLPDRAFDGDRLREMIDARAARADNPYETMTALSRRFVPLQMDDADWGEDSYTVETVDPRVMHVATISCRDGSVIYVREDHADRDWCASHGGRGINRGGNLPPYSDPVVVTHGRATDTHGDSRAGERIYRLPRPEVVQAGAPANDGHGWIGDTDIRQGGGSSNGAPAHGNDGADAGHGRGNNGNHFGRDEGSDTLKRNGNTHGNDQQQQNGNGQGNGQQNQNGNARGNDQQGQNANVRGADQQKPVDRHGWMQPRAVQPPVRTAPVEGAGEQRPVATPPVATPPVATPPVATPPVVRAPAPEVKSAPVAEPKPAPAPAADQQPRRPAKDSTDAPERHRPNPRVRPDSSSDKPAGDDKPSRQIE